MVLGIDLGTTYSVAAYVDNNGEPRAINNDQGDNITPSVVSFEDENLVIVGQTAKDCMTTDPQSVVATVKYNIGRKDKTYSPISDKVFTPQDISSFILRKLVNYSEIHFGNKEKITDVVVTIPAYFTDSQRQATNEAVYLAGLNLLGNVNEPTAAAVYYAHMTKMNKSNTLVFDLGGGTFDVTIMHIDHDDIEVKSTRGLNKIGGSFYDQALVDYIVEQFEEKNDIDLEEEEYLDIYEGLYEKVEKAKKQICSTKGQTIVPINAGGKRDRIILTYNYFVSIISDDCDKIENIVKRAIDDAGLKISDIDNVIMVGGSSRIPYIEERITKLMGKEPLRVVNPDEVVALGAAIIADRLSKKGVNPIKDVCSRGIGILRYDPTKNNLINHVLIKRNSTLPKYASSDEYAFSMDGQEELNIVFTEGDYEDSYTKIINGEIKIPLPKGIKKEMKYLITICLDETRNLSVQVIIPELSKKLKENITKKVPDEKDTNTRRIPKELSDRAKELLKIQIA